MPKLKYDYLAKNAKKQVKNSWKITLDLFHYEGLLLLLDLSITTLNYSSFIFYRLQVVLLFIYDFYAFAFLTTIYLILVFYSNLFTKFEKFFIN